jgi:hypothetical protein
MFTQVITSAMLTVVYAINPLPEIKEEMPPLYKVMLCIEHEARVLDKRHGVSPDKRMDERVNTYYEESIESCFERY